MPPKPNYQFEKRQRELAKKQRKEEKAQRKTQPQPGEAGGDDHDAPAAAEPSSPDAQAPAA